ncbi:MAG: FliM/FliN family flagellar motor switch protein [Candidatus Margulisbacteria bacterium]|nr:FliM/FliN family flagellar motor switch protein [Candidatus Margulisiibacteriota bacterium]
MLFKDIRLKSVIGKWYEYTPDKGYTNNFETVNLDAQQIDELLELHHKWAELFGTVLNQNLKISCGTQETSIARMKYSEMLNRAPNASTSFEALSIPEFTVVIDNLLAYALLDRACGGAGLVSKKLNEALTGIEEAALSPLLDELLKSYNAFLLGVLALHGPGELFAPKIKPEAKLKKDEEVIVFSNTFYLAENKPAELWFVYTEKTLEKLQEAYAQKKEARPKKISLHLAPEAITNVKVPVKLKIGSTKVTVNDILSLTPGDIFQLNERVSDALVLSVAEQSEFFVKLGSKSGQYAVKIVEHKPKYYNFAAPDAAVAPAISAPPPAVPAAVKPVPPPAESAPAATVETPAAADKAPAPPQSTAAASQPAAQKTVPPAPAVVDEQSVTYTPEGKVDADKLELKDPLLDELALPEDKTDAADSDDFTWDIDDLK